MPETHLGTRHGSSEYTHETVTGGPDTYSTGGFTLTTGAADASSVEDHAVVVDDEAVLGGNLALGIQSSVNNSGNIDVTLQSIDVSGSGGWSEVADTTDISAADFTAVVVHKG